MPPPPWPTGPCAKDNGKSGTVRMSTQVKVEVAFFIVTNCLVIVAFLTYNKRSSMYNFNNCNTIEKLNIDLILNLSTPDGRNTEILYNNSGFFYSVSLELRKGWWFMVFKGRGKEISIMYLLYFSYLLQ
jgi:hypothetical protein